MSAPRLWIDLETFSHTPIKDGTHAYAETASVLLFAWARDNEDVEVWDVKNSAGPPVGLWANLNNPEVEVWAHNSHFDRTVLRVTNLLAPWGLACPPRERWRDTMVQALAHGLPGKLSTLCEILQIPVDRAKDKEGRTLIQTFCKPRKDGSRNDAQSHPEAWARFAEYARLDVEAMRECSRRMPMWNYRGDELALWHLDQKINDRGFAVDSELAFAAVETVAEEQAALRKRTHELTDGAVSSATRRDALMQHIFDAWGVPMADMTAATVDKMLADTELPPGLGELLKVRRDATTTSTSKYKTLLRCMSHDRRLRGGLQYAGASRTRRWSGRLFQPQNLARPTLKPNIVDVDIKLIKSGAARLMLLDVMESLSSALRGCIVAPSGKKIVAADLANIEGRGLAWLVCENWKLKAFEAFDRGDGADLYKLAYARSFGIAPEDVGPAERQIGKVQELALGYEGGVGAFVAFALVYRIDLDEMAARVLDTIDREIFAEAMKAFDWARSKGNTYDLARDTYLACDAIKRAWRRAHPATVEQWGALQDACIRAVKAPGVTMHAGRLKARRDGAWLRVLLPSGKYLCYPDPRIDKGKLSYMGVDQYTRQWRRISTYGGKLIENATQALARDVLAHNMPAIDAEYPIVLSVHDELLTETPDSPEYSAHRLAEMMSTVPPWAPGLPLAAEGFEAYRYRKN